MLHEFDMRVSRRSYAMVDQVENDDGRHTTELPLEAASGLDQRTQRLVDHHVLQPTSSLVGLKEVSQNVGPSTPL